ncbi:MAG TPA: hypothetical protein VFH27_02135, partial [Longimicrobiaceae bacterium]|nr:hypothetical protein [Longimicrobiaceae bacterium]
MTAVESGAVPGTLAATRILDAEHPAIRRLAAEERATAGSDAEFVRAVHARLARTLRPVYTLDDALPASAVLARGA